MKRAAVGAEGFVLDHYDRAAIDNHLKIVGDRLMQAFGANPPYAVFSDSLEVYGSDWTADFLEEFQKRRGYDLTPYLPALAGDIGDKTAAIRHDWGQTLTELANEHYLTPMTRVGAAAWHAVPLADLRHSAGDDVEQCAGGPARGRRLAVAALHRDALGVFGEPSLRPAGDLFGNLDLAAFAGVPRHAARYEGRGRPAFPAGHQPARRPRLAVFAAAKRASRDGVSMPRRCSTITIRGGS